MLLPSGKQDMQKTVQKIKIQVPYLSLQLFIGSG
jgi:hypothetical protein